MIDEAQFLTKLQVYQLGRVCDELDIPVLAYGLRTDFQAEPFEGSQYLLAWADNLKELKAICDCGRRAIKSRLAVTQTTSRCVVGIIFSGTSSQATAKQ